MEREQIIKDIQAGSTALGIEFGSTRIKAVLVGSDNTPIGNAPSLGNVVLENVCQLFGSFLRNGIPPCAEGHQKLRILTRK